MMERGLPERRGAEPCRWVGGIPEAGSVRSPQVQPWQCHSQHGGWGIDRDAQFLILLIQVPAPGTRILTSLLILSIDTGAPRSPSVAFGSGLGFGRGVALFRPCRHPPDNTSQHLPVEFPIVWKGLSFQEPKVLFQTQTCGRQLMNVFS